MTPRERNSLIFFWLFSCFFVGAGGISAAYAVVFEGLAWRLFMLGNVAMCAYFGAMAFGDMRRMLGVRRGEQ